jgi:putative SOS response-associated peptidase YedK
MIGAWLSNETDKGVLKSILEPYVSSQTNAFKVSKYVNSPKNNDARCIEG